MKKKEFHPFIALLDAIKDSTVNDLETLLKKGLLSLNISLSNIPIEQNKSLLLQPQENMKTPNLEKNKFPINSVEESREVQLSLIVEGFLLEDFAIPSNKDGMPMSQTEISRIVRRNNMITSLAILTTREELPINKRPILDDEFGKPVN